jgi:hypothetical protein
VSVCEAEVVDVTLRYFDGCPNWQTAAARVRQVLDATGRAKVAINHEKVEMHES